MNELKRSKTYRYPPGHVNFNAPTVADLIAFLQQFPPDMPVLAEWEGTQHGFNSPEVAEFEGADALIFNVEYDDRTDPEKQ